MYRLLHLLRNLLSSRVLGMYMLPVRRAFLTKVQTRRSQFIRLAWICTTKWHNFLTPSIAGGCAVLTSSLKSAAQSLESSCRHALFASSIFLWQTALMLVFFQYADRKKWPLEGVNVEVREFTKPGKSTILLCLF